MQNEILTIKANKIIDFSSSYDVIDTKTNKKLGALKRKGLKSFFIDEWTIIDENNEKIGLIKETSMASALISRFINIIPQSYYAAINGKTVCEFKQNWNPFVHKIEIDFSIDPEKTFNKKLGIAAAILLNAIEGRQN